MASNDNLNSDTKQEQRNNQRGDQPHRGKRPSFAQLLEKMDANGDARLSKNEVKGPLSNNFSEVDTNADGYITALEFKNAPKPEGKQRPQRG